MASMKAAGSIFRSNLFKDKCAVVTGGGTGIGFAIAYELYSLGCNVLIASRKEDKLQNACKSIRNNDINSPIIDYAVCNIRKEDEVKNMIEGAIKNLGGLDFLVNNGGGQFISELKDIRPKGWHAVIETNLTGTFYCSKEAYNQCMVDKGGSIVNIVADMWSGMPLMGHSGAARAAVVNLTKTMAVEWAKSGVRINAVAPGSSIYSPTAAANYGDYNPFAAQESRIPAKRLGTVEEISSIVCYLLSPASTFISGETIKVDGAQNLYSTSLPFEIDDHSNNEAFSWIDNDEKSKL